jgi:hypothetical protein
MTEAEAIKLGEAAGVEAVDAVYNEQGIDAVAACQKPGHDGWDEAAAAAGAHRVDGVPEDLRDEYYGAYNRAANEYTNRLIANES